MALPETDLHRIRLWAQERVPEHLWVEQRPTTNVQALLDHVETSGDPIFWG